MDRQGKVLSVSLERSSGIRSLDQEALALPKRIAATHLRPADRCLAAIITRCGIALQQAGLMLYPLTLYQYRLQSGT